MSVLFTDEKHTTLTQQLPGGKREWKKQYSNPEIGHFIQV